MRSFYVVSPILINKIHVFSKNCNLVKKLYRYFSRRFQPNRVGFYVKQVGNKALIKPFQSLFALPLLLSSYPCCRRQNHRSFCIDIRQITRSSEDEICRSVAENGGIDSLLICIDESGAQGNNIVAKSCCSLLSKRMGKKRKDREAPSDDDDTSRPRTKRTDSDQLAGKPQLLPSMIKNKEKRSAVYAKLKHEKKVEKRKNAKAREALESRALELGEELPPKKIPRTIENTREADETVCKPDDEELFAGNDADEFSTILNSERPPKVLMTTCRFHSTRGPALIKDLLTIIPNAEYYKRGTYDLKNIVEYANNKEFTSVIVVHTSRREPDALLIIGLPNGPTAHFKLSNLVLHKDLKNHGNPTNHKPELVLNNFTTRLGHRVGRLIQSLFPQDPEFRGRRVVTFHNQRDFIFFRHHRYIFETKEDKQNDANNKNKDTGDEKKLKGKIIARLQECGPRFTLKLTSLQHGTFDTKGGEYEWVHKPEMDTSRRRFFL